MMPTDSVAFMNEWKGKPLDGKSDHRVFCSFNHLVSAAIVEQVRDGSMLRVRLLLPDGDHQYVNLNLAGVRSPRVANRPEETSEPLGEEVSTFLMILCVGSNHQSGEMVHGAASSATFCQGHAPFTS